MSRRYYASDPRWITARYPGKCEHCGATIKAGASIFYYPSSKTVLCAGEECGKQADRDTNAANHDERWMQNQFPAWD